MDNMKFWYEWFVILLHNFQNNVMVWLFGCELPLSSRTITLENGCGSV